MAADNPPPNTLLPLGELRSTRAGDLPAALRRRYFVEDHGREHRYFLDATGRTPMIADRGRRLISARSDPNAVRDLVAIASHRGWRTVEAKGAAPFRREAWLQGRSQGLEVRGYRPTERDRQALARIARDRPPPGAPTPPVRRPPERHPAVRDRLRVAEQVVRGRVADPAAQERILAAARARIADWLERGARFTSLREPAEHGERRRGR